MRTEISLEDMKKLVESNANRVSVTLELRHRQGHVSYWDPIKSIRLHDDILITAVRLPGVYITYDIMNSLFLQFDHCYTNYRGVIETISS